MCKDAAAISFEPVETRISANILHVSDMRGQALWPLMLLWYVPDMEFLTAPGPVRDTGGLTSPLLGARDIGPVWQCTEVAAETPALLRTLIIYQGKTLAMGIVSFHEKGLA